jgi:hypothetical protein
MVRAGEYALGDKERVRRWWCMWLSMGRNGAAGMAMTVSSTGCPWWTRPCQRMRALEKNRPVWITRMEALQGQEDNTTMKFMTTYMLSLDKQHDRQSLELRKCIHRTEEAEIYARKPQVLFTEAHARAAAVEKLQTTITQALKEAEHHHAQQLKSAYLITKPKQRMFDTHTSKSS